MSGRIRFSDDFKKDAVLQVLDRGYIRTHEGWIYLAVVIDLFSRRVVGWSMQSRMTNGEGRWNTTIFYCHTKHHHPRISVALLGKQGFSRSND